MSETQLTKRTRNQQYRSTPGGAAGCAWNRLTSRAGAKYGHRQCYAAIEVRMTRAEFVAWATPEYARWFAERPGVTPSLDRIDSTKHYELGNLQLIPVEANRYKNSRHRNKDAPEGFWWCCRCQAYVTTADFDRNKAMVKAANPSGFATYCKPCRRARWQEAKAAGKIRRSNHSSKITEQP